MQTRLLVGGLLLSGLASPWAQQAGGQEAFYGKMHPTEQEFREAVLTRLAARQIAAPKGAEKDFKGSVDLLPLVPYIAAERQQGACGSCWTWAGTGIMEVAHRVQNGVSDRLSVQYIVSCETAVPCCTGANIDTFRAFYAAQGFAIPWSNANAQYTSAGATCAACGNIATTPRYTITSITNDLIQTWGVGKATAINNIKYVLNQNKAVCFGIYGPDAASDTDIINFWGQPEATLMTNFWCGRTYMQGAGGWGHAMLCVGYNDDNANNRYWVILNSWGAPAGRPTGVLRVSMDIDYDCALIINGQPAYSISWETLDVQFAASGPAAPVLSDEPATTPGTANTIYWTPGAKLAQNSSPAGQAGASEPATLKIRAASSPDRSSFALFSGPESVLAGVAPAEKVAAGASADWFVGNASAPSGRAGLVPAVQSAKPGPGQKGWQTVLNETFEGGFPGTGWNAFSTLPGWAYWDDVTGTAHSGTRSIWCAGTYWAPANGYVNEMHAWTFYGPFSLADATDATVSFWFTNYSELNWDLFKFGISTNGNDIIYAEWSGVQSAWLNPSFSFTNVGAYGNLCGKSQVWIAFVFDSDSSVCGDVGYTGAFVDDVVIQKNTGGGGTGPDLVPVQPGEWNSIIPIGVTQLSQDDTHNYTGPYPSTQPLYCNWMLYNNGNAAAGASRVRLEVSGAGGITNNSDVPNLPAGQTLGPSQDLAVGPLAAGSHTFKLWVDYNGAVAETNENNNYYERTIQVVGGATNEYYAQCANDAGFATPANSGWITNTQCTFTGLTPGQSYWYRVKARQNGQESAWSNVEHSQQEDATPVISVTPSSLNFGSVGVGSSVDRIFYVTNTGGGTLAGSAAVAAPFSIVSGGSYGLGAGQGQGVGVRFTPTTAGTSSNNVTFTGGAGATRPVTGVATQVVVQVSATHANAGGYPVAGGLLTMNCLFYYTNQALLSLLWHPILPQGFVLTNIVSGDGNPEVQGGDIVFIGSLAANPIHLSYTIVVSPVAQGSATNKPVSADVQYQQTGMVNPSTVRALPEPLLVPPILYHAADYQDPRWFINGTEVNRVLTYWRSGAYHCDAAGADGYAAGTGSTNGPLHSADYKDPRWFVDGTEVNRVLTYWRAGAYHVDPNGADGYAAGTNQSLMGAKAAGAPAPGVVPRLRQQGPAVYVPGTVIRVTNTVEYTAPLLSLLARPQLPEGWTIQSASGAGNPETVAGEVVWTGTIPPSPITAVYALSVPANAKGPKQVGGSIEYQALGTANPAGTTAEPGPLMLNPFQISRISRLADGSVALNLPDLGDQSAEVQVSSDLVHWEPLTTQASIEGSFRFIDPAAPQHTQRFYRAVLGPKN